jgi:hypothetical protein
VGTGAQEVESAADENAANEARARAIQKIKELMKGAGIDEKSAELEKAEDIYDAVRQFLENTDFNPSLLPPHKY